jgi:pentose-5-phosphate-3-epimerase
VHRSVQAIKAKGCKAGLVFNPATPLDVLDWVIEEIDLVLIMSVNPGFGGQGFIESALRKIEQARKRIDASGKDIRLEVDGGIKTDNIARVAVCRRRHLRGRQRHLRQARLQGRHRRDAQGTRALSGLKCSSRFSWPTG